MLFDPEGDVKELGKGSILKITNKIIQGNPVVAYSQLDYAKKHGMECIPVLDKGQLDTIENKPAKAHVPTKKSVCIWNCYSDELLSYVRAPCPQEAMMKYVWETCSSNFVKRNIRMTLMA